MEDIEAVIKASQHFKYESDESEPRYAFNKISDLPEFESVKKDIEGFKSNQNVVPLA